MPEAFRRSTAHIYSCCVFYMIGRISFKIWQIFLLFTISLELIACNGEGSASKLPVSTDTLRHSIPVPTDKFIEVETSIPIAISTVTPSQDAFSGVITRFALDDQYIILSTSLSCWSKGGSIQTGSLSTDILKEPLDFRVYLPPCYTQQQDRFYPVLYLFHGQGFLDDQWDRIGIDEAADSMIAKEEISPLIIVMPHERGSEQPIGSKFAQAFIEELIPFIDSTYRTFPDRAHRAVGGLSRGGGWAVQFGISEWEIFGALGAHSPGIFRADDLYLRKWLDTIPKGSYPRIYIDIGDRDLPVILESSIWFEELLNERDIPHDWHFFTGYHNEEYWHAHLNSYLRWYALTW